MYRLSLLGFFLLSSIEVISQTGCLLLLIVDVVVFTREYDLIGIALFGVSWLQILSVRLFWIVFNWTGNSIWYTGTNWQMVSGGLESIKIMIFLWHQMKKKLLRHNQYQFRRNNTVMNVWIGNSYTQPGNHSRRPHNRHEWYDHLGWDIDRIQFCVVLDLGQQCTIVRWQLCHFVFQIRMHIHRMATDDDCHVEFANDHRH